MQVRVFQHVPFEGVGTIQAWLSRQAARVTYTRMFQGDPVPEPGARDDTDLLIVMGGPMGVNEEHLHPWLVAEKRAILGAVESGRCVLGICLGAQLIAAALGARVYRNAEKEIGWHEVRRTGTTASGVSPSTLAAAIPNGTVPFHWHSDTFDPPRGAECFLSSEACGNQAFHIGDRVLGLQFHLETTAQSARALMENCGDDLSPGKYVQRPTEILSQPARFSALVPILERMLDILTAAAGPAFS